MVIKCYFITEVNLDTNIKYIVIDNNIFYNYLKKK